ncbi:utrophin isoform X7 [Lates japonicus]|uniref:Utrophin isoform X7 n=1 Tax=Lates japonicus TaxID=270547 RepID=A0AAD3NC44_LATJO|nr:utrophin isoform X7 [Lates japonicus]
MMAMVRTSLQKVVVFLHRLQRMAISSPRYQKLCKNHSLAPFGILSGPAPPGLRPYRRETSVIPHSITLPWVASVIPASFGLPLGESVMPGLSCLPGARSLAARLEP